MTDEVSRLRIEGLVQGVGFRPFVARMALDLGLSGWVRNEGGAVEIYAEGPPHLLSDFIRGLKTSHPPSARIDQILELQSSQIPRMLGSGFQIQRSIPSTTIVRTIPVDRPICNACLREMTDSVNRRYRYPFTHCTDCGPRYTLVTDFPIDRARTTMAPFLLCKSCQEEYHNPQDRRFHAEVISCPDCGPSLTLVEGAVERQGSHFEILDRLGMLLRSGAIVAVRGVGGYHLLCDARSKSSIDRIRVGKRRPSKPFAVMIPRKDASGLQGYEDLVAESNPIVLVPKTHVPELALNVAPGLAEVGLLLPHSPLHEAIVMSFGGPLVVTSANAGGEPILTLREEAETLLFDGVDAFLHHDREILRPADDPVYRLIAGRLRPLRHGRGSSPLSWDFPEETPIPLLSTGGDLKNTLGMAKGRQIVLTPHLGSLFSLRSRSLFLSLIEDFRRLLHIDPQAIVCDAHPDCHGGIWAESLGLPIYRVFHHHAHASAVYGEFQCQGPILCFAFDGFGWGPNRSLWGGEVFVGEPGAWRQVGGLRPFHLPGGERASREVFRCGVSLSSAVGLEWFPEELRSGTLQHPLRDEIAAPLTSSVGRLFDGVAALLGVCFKQEYEGHAAMLLEALASPTDEIVPMPLYQEGGLDRWDWSILIRAMLSKDYAPEEKASLFHQSLAAAVLEMSRLQRSATGMTRVGLSGGVFQNALLTAQVKRLLTEDGFEVLIPEIFPVNDAAISFGQIIEASAVLRAGKKSRDHLNDLEP